MIRYASALALAVILSGCSTIKLSNLPEDTAKREPIHKPATKPYQVKGIWYYPQKDASEPLDEVGLASWYGHPFHGRKTSNGEIFDKDKISAAHKTITIPSYVKVTVLETGKSMIIRVNDRGPFAEGRVIDLSEAAAIALGTHAKGLAKVRVTKIIDPNQVPDHSGSISSSIFKKVISIVKPSGGSVSGTVSSKKPFEIEIRVRKSY